MATSVLDRLDELTRLAEERMAASDPMIFGAMGGASIEFMTAAEREERHRLMQSLPTFAEERILARERIAARLLTRKRGRQDAIAQ